MNRVLVVGAASPLGTAIGAALRATGHEVHGTSRSGSEGTIPFDLSNGTAGRELLGYLRPDSVVFLARPDGLPDDDAVDDAVDDARRFAEECREATVTRLIFASSAAVYGTASPEPRAEHDPTPAPGQYAQLKLRTERVLEDVARAGDCRVVALRVFNVFGPGLGASLVNRLRDAIAGGERPAVYPTDNFVRDYVHVADVADAFVAALRLDGGWEVVNVGTGVGTANLELVGLVPDSAWRPASGALAERSVSVADVGRLTRLLGAVPLPRVADYLAGADDSPPLRGTGLIGHGGEGT